MKISAAITQIAAEKNLEKDALVGIIEAAIRTAYKKDFGHKDEIINVQLNLDKGTLEITQEKTVVEELENPHAEITLEELGEDADSFEVGDVVEFDVSDVLEEHGNEFGRIASQAARQVIIQKLGESEKSKIYQLFADKQDTLVSVKVDMVERNKVFLDYNGSQIILPRSEQVSRDAYEAGKRLQVYVSKVEDDEKTGPRVTLSRKNINLVTKLFEINTPELEEGTVEIIKIVRNPGFKTKMIVGSEYEEIDPAGSLIGPKGTRVKAVVEELNGEKIDIINYSDDIREMIGGSLSPAKVVKVDVDEDTRTATVEVEKDDELKAIGRGGKNIRLAEELTGYRITLKKDEQEATETTAE